MFANLVDACRSLQLYLTLCFGQIWLDLYDILQAVMHIYWGIERCLARVPRYYKGRTRKYVCKYFLLFWDWLKYSIHAVQFAIVCVPLSIGDLHLFQPYGSHSLTTFEISYIFCNGCSWNDNDIIITWHITVECRFTLLLRLLTQYYTKRAITRRIVGIEQFKLPGVCNWILL